MTVTEFFQTQVPFLSGLSPEQAQGLAAQAEQRSFGPGQTILFRGTTCDGLYVVAAGKVAVWAKPEKGKTLIEVAQLGPGEVFGETSIIEMSTAGATVKALQSDTLVFVISQEAFREILTQNPDFQARASALIAERKKKTVEFLAVPRFIPQAPLSAPAAA